MRQITYYDKNKQEIKEGMMLRHEEGEIEKVYSWMSSDGIIDFGFNASNEAWLERQYGTDKEYFREFYPLTNFNLKEWEIIEDGQ